MINYDNDKIGIKVTDNDHVIHIYADKDNHTGRRCIILLAGHTAHICEMEGNPLSPEYVDHIEPRMIKQAEADKLMSILFSVSQRERAGEQFPFDVRAVRFNAKNSTFWVRFSSEAMPEVNGETLTESAARAMVKDYKEAMQ